MIQGLYQALQISLSWERVSEIQSIKDHSDHVVTSTVNAYGCNLGVCICSWRPRSRHLRTATGNLM